MAWTQTDIDALKTAIAKAERRVTYGDKTVEYRSLDEMLKALAVIQAEVTAANGGATPSRTIYVQHGRGV